jgi:hypothetical protein
LQNCGAQLVTFDVDVSNKLNALANWLRRFSEKVKEYFARANETNYFPEQDLDGGSQFQIHVTAYSGVGYGAHFEVSIDNGTVELISSTHRFDGMGQDDVNDDTSETNEADYGGSMDAMGDDVKDDTSKEDEYDYYAFEDLLIEEEDEWDSPTVEALYLKAAVDDIEASTSKKAL